MRVWHSTRAFLVVAFLTAIVFANFAKAFNDGTNTSPDDRCDVATSRDKTPNEKLNSNGTGNTSVCIQCYAYRMFTSDGFSCTDNISYMYLMSNCLAACNKTPVKQASRNAKYTLFGIKPKRTLMTSYGNSTTLPVTETSRYALLL
jgi:hypothetical protein